MASRRGRCSESGAVCCRPRQCPDGQLAVYLKMRTHAHTGTQQEPSSLMQSDAMRGDARGVCLGGGGGGGEQDSGLAGDPADINFLKHFKLNSQRQAALQGFGGSEPVQARLSCLSMGWTDSQSIPSRPSRPIPSHGYPPPTPHLAAFAANRVHRTHGAKQKPSTPKPAFQ